MFILTVKSWTRSLDLEKTNNIDDYTKAYATKHQLTTEQAQEHKMVQLVQAYYEETERYIVKDVSVKRKCDG